MSDHLLTPPTNREAEQSVLGALLADREALGEALARLQPEDFFTEDNRAVYRAILALHERGAAFDTNAVMAHLEAERNTDLSAYVIGLHGSPRNIVTYCDAVRTASLKRQLIEIGTAITARGYNCASPEEIITEGFASLSGALSRTEAKSIEPVDMFSDYATSALAPDLLPPGVAEYAIDQARVIGIAPEMVALSCLGTIAGAIHDDFKIRPKANEAKWSERACLWFMLIAPPGSKKSAAVKRAMAPLRAIDAELTAEHSAAMRDFLPKEREYAIRAKDAARNAAKGQGYEEPPQPPERPAQRRAIVQDVTTEKLGELLLDNPRGLTWYSDELVVWFSALQGYSKGDGGRGRGMALQAYEGGSYTFDRIGRGSTHVPNWSYSVIGTTQPEKLSELVAKQADDGLLQRFMIVDITTRPPLPDHDRPADPRIERQYEETIRNVWNTKPGESGTIVTMSPEAQADMRAFSDFVNRTVAGGGLPSMLIGHLSKWEGLWPRLVLVYHCWGCALAGKHPGTTPVSARTTGRVTRFMKEFLLPQSLRFYGGLAGAGDSVYGIAQKVASMILSERSARVTSRELHRSVNAWRVTSEQNRRASIQLLKECGWIIASESGRMGGESAWIVAPQVHVMFAERAQQERKRRAEARDGMRSLRDVAGLR